MQPDAAPSCRTVCKGKIPGEEEEMFGGNGIQAIAIAVSHRDGVIVVFTFVIVVHWVDTQRKEREAFYKTETLRRITEASGEGAKAAVELDAGR